MPIPIIAIDTPAPVITTTFLSLKMVGFDTEESKAVEFAIGAYTVTTENDEKKYSYLQHGTPLEGDKYAFIKYNDFVKTFKCNHFLANIILIVYFLFPMFK